MDSAAFSSFIIRERASPQPAPPPQADDGFAAEAMYNENTRSSGMEKAGDEGTTKRRHPPA